jgi:hypothetical protein
MDLSRSATRIAFAALRLLCPLPVRAADREAAPPEGDAPMPLQVRRLPGNPIITPAADPSIGENINGPSLIRVPDWVEKPLGRYYLYFAHHGGTHIRLAYADEVTGPYTVHPPGVLSLEETPGRSHVASPDVHVDEEARRIRMYFHAVGQHPDYPGKQVTYLALSEDGLRFAAREPVMGPFYLRAFPYAGAWYAIAKNANVGQVLLRSPDGLEPFTLGPELLPDVRHTAVRVEGRRLRILFSRKGDAPEHLLSATMALTGAWRAWPESLSAARSLLKPEESWEGADLPLAPSRWGAAKEPVNQLRDPALYEEDGRLYLLYSVAGESGLAIAALEE